MKEDGTLDEAAVTEYLEQANRIYQTGKTGIDALKAQGFAVYSIGERNMMSDISASAISVLGGYYKLSVGRLLVSGRTCLSVQCRTGRNESDTQSLERTGTELLYPGTDSGNQR